MKKILEIYDISKEYEQEENTLLVIVSKHSQESILKLFPSLTTYTSQFMTEKEWSEFLSVKKVFENNEDKHRMRNRKNELQYEKNDFISNYDDEISTILNNKMLSENLEYALSKLTETSRKRFLLYYSEHMTYRQIGQLEGKNPKTIYESVKSARKKFLKLFKNTPTK